MSLDVDGWLHVPAAVPSPRLAQLTARAAHAFADLDAAVAARGWVAVAGDPQHWPTASSVRLDSPPLDLLAPLDPLLRGALGPALWVAADQAWLRRQLPRDRAAPHQQPHGWHQDGALGADFSRPGPLLRTLTCWFALNPCGVDAPGLELALDRAAARLDPGHTPGPRRVRPVLQAGDALVFTGDVVHRTHLTDAMDQTRTSVEIRVYAAPPAQLAAERFVELRAPADP